MSRLRLTLVGLILAAVYVLYGSWSPPLPPEPPHRVTRGESIDAKYDQWLMAVRTYQAGLAGEVVSFDTSSLTFVATIIGIMTGVLFLLSRYVIGPMISKQVNKSMMDLDKRFCTRNDLVVMLMATDNEKALLQLSNIWKAENR